MVRLGAVAFSVMLMLRLMPVASGAEDAAELPRIVTKSGCVTCHAQAGSGGGVFQAYIQWASSPHAAKSIACEACHGGNAATDDKDKAHAGMLPASDPQSPINPKNVPAMCGQCHEPEYRHYIESKHYQQLKDNGRGANCVTCHGAKAGTILTAATVARTCETCHNPDRQINPAVPGQAFRALLRLTEARGQLDLAQAAVLTAREQKSDSDVLERGISRSRKSLDQAITEWHTFNLPLIEAATTEAYDFALQTKLQAEQGVVGTVLLQGKGVFWQALTLALLTAALLSNLLILLKVSRRPPRGE
jgi:hypothetical protein